MKDLRKVSPTRMNILQELDLIAMEIDIVTVGFEQLNSAERKQVHSKIEQLYTKRASLKHQLRKQA